MAKVRIDWDKYYRMSPVIPHETIADKETGLIRIATTQSAFDKFLEFTRGKAISREKLIKYYEYQNVVFLDEEEFYNLNPEYWQELKLEIKEG
jgi:hypothetical protein